MDVLVKDEEQGVVCLTYLVFYVPSALEAVVEIAELVAEKKEIVLLIFN